MRLHLQMYTEEWIKRISANLKAKSVKNLDKRKCIVSRPSLSSEKRKHEEKSRRRLNTHLAILRTSSVVFSWLKLIQLSFSTICFGFIFTFPLILVPAHDLVKCPEYWYESLYHAAISTIESCLLNCCLSDYFLNVNYSFKLKTMAYITLITTVLAEFIIIAAYIIWTPVLAYQYPIPFLGNALMIEHWTVKKTSDGDVVGATIILKYYIYVAYSIYFMQLTCILSFRYSILSFQTSISKFLFKSLLSIRLFTL